MTFPVRDRSNGIGGLCSIPWYPRSRTRLRSQRTLIMSLPEPTPDRRELDSDDGTSGVQQTAVRDESTFDRPTTSADRSSGETPRRERRDVLSDVGIDGSTARTDGGPDDRGDSVSASGIRFEAVSTPDRSGDSTERTPSSGADGSFDRVPSDRTAHASEYGSSARFYGMQSRLGRTSTEVEPTRVGYAVSDIAVHRARSAVGSESSDSTGSRPHPCVSQPSGYLARD